MGIGLRLAVAARGYNYDVDAFLVVADIVKHGGNVYVETARYNYGPVWFAVISILDNAASAIQGDRALVFRYLLAGFLSLVDAGIFLVLWKKAGRVAACLFFLNPIAVIITGYHSQFDNLAVFLGLLAVLMLGDDFDKPLDGKKAAGLIVLGVSLATKHLFFAFPLWLAVKQRGLMNKAAMAGIPILVFLLGFLPYWREGRQGILDHVIFYKSLDNQYFYQWFAPGIIRNFADARWVWFFLLFIFAFVYRRRNAFDSLLAYTCVLVAASPSMANQYLAIPIPFISMNYNLFFLAYVVVGTWHLIIDGTGLHIARLRVFQPKSIDNYVVLVVLLSLGFAWHLWINELLPRIRKKAQ